MCIINIVVLCAFFLSLRTSDFKFQVSLRIAALSKKTVRVFNWRSEFVRIFLDIRFQEHCSWLLTECHAMSFPCSFLLIGPSG